uniref:Uncharacterized protein n=1 Tax=Mus musculus TaxID=10090 RepID=Q3UUF1_MOUSE|nr:unnamed protein product [Mus musculus]
MLQGLFYATAVLTPILAITKLLLMSATGEAVTSPDMMNRRHVVVIRQKTYTQPSLRGQTESLYMMQVYQVVSTRHGKNCTHRVGSTKLGV